jgi:nucleoside-diphosphate-sugar epimerase
MMTPSKRSSVLVAGATGAIGRRLVPQLVDAGYRVVGLTRDPAKADSLLEAGAIPVIADVFDAERLTRVMMAARPDAVIHQLTDLPGNLDASRMQEGIVRNARIRAEGTRNLMAAAQAAGVARVVAQSIAWAYAPGPKQFSETDALDVKAEGMRSVSVAGVVALEKSVLESSGVVLRYGQLWGEGTGADTPEGKDRPLHVDGAVSAAIMALEVGAAGVYNIADDDRVLDLSKARGILGWVPGLRGKVRSAHGGAEVAHG